MRFDSILLFQEIAIQQTEEGVIVVIEIRVSEMKCNEFTVPCNATSTDFLSQLQFRRFILLRCLGSSFIFLFSLFVIRQIIISFFLVPSSLQFDSTVLF